MLLSEEKILREKIAAFEATHPESCPGCKNENRLTLKQKQAGEYCKSCLAADAAGY